MVVDTLVLDRHLHYRITPSDSPTKEVIALPYEDVVLRNLFSITHADGTKAPYIGPEPKVLVEGENKGEKKKMVPPYRLHISHEYPFENRIFLEKYWKLEKTGQYTIQVNNDKKHHPLETNNTKSTFYHEMKSELAKGTSFERAIAEGDFIGMKGTVDQDGFSFLSEKERSSSTMSSSKERASGRPTVGMSNLGDATDKFLPAPTRIIGSHRTYSVLDDSGVSDHINNLYNAEKKVESLDQVHLVSEDWTNAKKNNYTEVQMLQLSMEQDIDLHKKFYKNMKSDPEQKFLNSYKKFVQSVMRFCFPDEKWMLYQTMPNIRFHVPESATVPPHRDMDIGEDRTPHPHGEENFLYTLTRAHQSRSVIMETSPGLGDWTFLEQDAGELLHFYGNRCVHLNVKNSTGLTRVSIDFRCIRVEDYLRNQKLMQTRSNANRETYSLVLGSYYEMMQLAPDFIMQMRPKFDEKEASACYQYLLTDAFVTEFKVTKKLEQELADFLGIKHCFMNCNGTLAISAALNALGIQPGDQVLVPTYTMVASANAVRFIGAVPVFCDVSKETLTISPDIVKPYLEKDSGFDIKCVIHVSLNNRINKLEEIAKMCKEKNIWLLEDAAQSLGAYYKGQHIGGYGDVCTLSFSSPKIISMGQGGAVLTNNDNVAANLRKNKDFGRLKPGVEEYDDFGINMKVTDVQSTIGLVQMGRLPGRIQQVLNIQKTYESVLGNYMLTTTSTSQTQGISSKEWSDPGWLPWFIEIFLEDEYTRDQLSTWLKSIGVGTRKVYPSIHLQPAYASQTSDSCMYKQVADCAGKEGSGANKNDEDKKTPQSSSAEAADLVYQNNKKHLPNAYKAMQTGLWLPSYADLEPKTVHQISLCIRAYLSTCSKFTKKLGQPPAPVPVTVADGGGSPHQASLDQRLNELEESRGYGIQKTDLGAKQAEKASDIRNLLNTAFGAPNSTSNSSSMSTIAEAVAPGNRA